MFSITNPDASLFQGGSGRAPQMRQRLLRQHGWALAMRRRMSSDARKSGGARTPLHLRCPIADELREPVLSLASGASAPLSHEITSPSLNLFY